MGRFNTYLYAFICCLPLGLVSLIVGIPFYQIEQTASGLTLIALGIIILSIAAILLIAGLVKFGRQTV